MSLTIRQRVDAMYECARDAQEVIAALRKECKHPCYSVEWWSFRVGTMHPARICTDCDHNLGQPGEHETKVFLDLDEARRKAAMERVLQC